MKFSISPALLRQYAIVTLGKCYLDNCWLDFIREEFKDGVIVSLSDHYNVNFGSLTTGMSMSWPSPMILKLSNGTDTPFSRPITDEEGSWIVSGGYLAAIFTNVVAGILMDKIGRKYCIILITIPRMCASVWIIFVTEVWMLTLCRAVMVITDSFIFVAVPVYVSEIASKEHRGTLGTFLHISSCAGIVIILTIGPFLSYIALNTLLATLIVLTALPLPFIPDSPVYLHSKGHINDSIAILSKIRISDEIIKQEIEDYKLSKVEKINKIALFKDKIFLKSLALGILICGGANALGYNAVSFYLQSILESTKTSIKSNLASVIIGIIQIIAALCTTFFTRLFGRRPILIYSIIGLVFGMLGLGIYFKIKAIPNYTVTGVLNYLPLISLVLNTYCFNVGIGCLLFVVTAEVFDGPARAFGYSICIMSAYLLAFLTSKYFAQMTNALGPSVTYWIFSGICFIVGTLIYFFIPETKGKTFNEIQISLGRKNLDTESKKEQKQYC